MSYVSPSSFGDYYDSGNQGQNVQNSYNGGRQPASHNPYATQASYPGDIRQSRYGSSGYDYARQNQQNYANSSRQQTYSNDSWKNSNTQNTSYDDRRQGDSYTTGGTMGDSGQGYYNSTPSTSAGQDVHELNNLAYASGLEDSAASQRQTHHVHHQSASSAARHPPTSGATAPNRVLSPVTQSASRYNVTPAMKYPYHNEPPSGSSQQAPISAAAALAGAVNRCFPQPSVSPVMDTVKATQASAAQRSASPYPQSTQEQAQLRTSSGTPRTTYGSSSISAGTMGQQWSQSGSAGRHVRAPSQNTQPRASRPQTQASAPVNSISNLVTNTMEEAPQTVYSPTMETQNMVPDYIDPSKVFNPYHLEHERRRREAEAQAKRKAEEAAAAAREREVEEAARKKKEEEEAARKKKEEEEAARKKAQEAAAAQAKRKAQDAVPIADRQISSTVSGNASSKVAERISTPRTQQLPGPSQQAAQSSQTGSTSEADMAAELKALMDRMKEFRNKDPSLFQKLWDDMRKPGQGPAPAVPAHSPSPQMSQQAVVPSQNQPVSATLPRPAPAATGESSMSPQVAHPQTISTHNSLPTTAETPKSGKMQLSTPDSTDSRRLNGYRVVVEDNDAGLPDLGRFPAERRIRTSYYKKPATPANVPLPDAVVPPDGTTQSIADAPVDPAKSRIAVPPPPVALTFSNARTPALAQGLPPKAPAGGTIWPEEKRNALAEAAVRSLTALPENSGVQISPADIHAMLDKNPSYLDLCEMLEGKGLRFNRGHFARQLLSNVPYLNGSSAKTVQSQPHPPALQPGQTSTQVVGQRLSNPAIQSPATPAVSAPKQNAISGQPVRPTQYTGAVPPAVSISGQNQARAVKPEKLPSESQQHAQNRRASKASSSIHSRTEPPPGSKEAMARKRDFSELIDLAALSDNEDYVMSRKQARIDSPSPERDVFEQYHQQMLSAAHVHSPGQGVGSFVQPPPLQSGPPLKFNTAPTPMLQGSRQFIHPSTTSRLAEPVLSTRLLAKPINKSEALRKTYYNPKTIARDILIAAGRHPTERPLNAHMAGLLGKHIELDSDLSTFDWDAVDPGGPPIPQVVLVDVPTEPPRYKSGQQGIRRIEPNNDNHNGSPLPDSEKRGMPAPAPKSKANVAEQREDKAKQLQSSAQPGTDSRPSQVQRSRDSNAAGAQNAKVVIPQKRKASVTSPEATPRPQLATRSTRSSSTQARPASEPDKMSDGSVFPSLKRRGRPPGAKNRPREYAETIKQGAKQEISVTVPSPASPSLPVYRCHWKGCKAHLHNLATLRQHISKVHRPTAEEVDKYGYICWWKKCQYLKFDNDGLITPQKVFDRSNEWLGHIDEDHLHPIALKYGDGPSTKHIGKQESSSFDVSRLLYNPLQSRQATRTLSHTDPQTILQDRTRYLSDESGRTTTPAISKKSLKDLEPDTMALLKAGHDDAEGMAQRSFMKTHRAEKSSPKAVAEETLRAMEARKAALGPGIDKGGCILVNEARRATLMQNPRIRRVVHANY
ncbi:hypothetical protein A1O1_02697 [Capronia coronata CBS 617.96]|uniref:C2H2-type domain-containing protein n=1 Tax=Capronia coronata CBS 617.96 TaxID=1182541 RepID=W9YP20_9EURO|nr:uncharacterized protein A1O1_02697 [Capronia coronata CBS 617.96]EXJ94303.1 hypothetical protein A1O1_02697 [Capronia coronata CBS 617.96]